MQGVGADEEARAPVMALEKLLQQANGGFTREQLGLVEMSETSAAQALAVRDAFDLRGRAEPDGGALARGHPLGAASAVSVVRLFTRMAAARQNGGGSSAPSPRGRSAGWASPRCSRRFRQASVAAPTDPMLHSRCAPVADGWDGEVCQQRTRALL